MRMVGITAFLLSLLLSLLLKNVAAALLGIAIFFCLGPYQEQRLGKQAKMRRQKLAEDLPRFIDLFATAVEIGVPVESAIKTTAQDIPSSRAYRTESSTVRAS